MSAPTRPYDDRPVGIITPEAVVLEFETAGVASRVLARLLDAVVIWLGLLAASLAIGALGASGEGTAGYIVAAVLVIAVLFGYWIVLETLLRGRTPGKMALGIRVVTVEGAPVRFRHTAIRAMVGVVDFFLPPLGPVAVVSVLVTSSDQRLGDLAAGTIVLRERAASDVVQSVNLTEPAGREELLGRLQLARMTDPQYNVIRRFLLRTPSLTPDARTELGAKLAASVERSTGVARPTDLHPEWFLHAAGLAHQRRSRMHLAVDAIP